MQSNSSTHRANEHFKLVNQLNIAFDIGICYSFNAKSTIELLKNSTFKESFQEVYKEDILNSSKIRKSEGAGQKFSLRFIIDNSRYLRPMRQSRPFKVYVSSSDGYMMSYESGAAEISPGSETTFVLQVS